jgi:hypothetical protein
MRTSATFMPMATRGDCWTSHLFPSIYGRSPSKGTPVTEPNSIASFSFLCRHRCLSCKRVSICGEVRHPSGVSALRPPSWYIVFVRGLSAIGRMPAFAAVVTRRMHGRIHHPHHSERSPRDLVRACRRSLRDSARNDGVSPLVHSPRRRSTAHDAQGHGRLPTWESMAVYCTRT